MPTNSPPCPVCRARVFFAAGAPRAETWKRRAAGSRSCDFAPRCHNLGLARLAERRAERAEPLGEKIRVRFRCRRRRHRRRGNHHLQLLESRKFPFRTIKFLASQRSAGKTITFAGTPYTVEELRPEAFDGVQLAIASTPDDVARDFIPDAVAPRLRGDRRERLLADGSQGAAGDSRGQSATRSRRHQGIISSPNCSTTQMVQALKPLHDAGRVRRVIVSTYQATSGAGSGRHPRPRRRHPRRAGRPGATSTRPSPTASPSTAFRRSARPSTRATRRKR